MSVKHYSYQHDRFRAPNPDRKDPQLSLETQPDTAVVQRLSVPNGVKVELQGIYTNL